MINTTAANSNIAANQNISGKSQTGKSGDFSSALSISDSLYQLTSNLLDSILKSRKGDTTESSSQSVFPFSSDFTSVFGDSGPLLDFINSTTASLNLSAKQNQALQDIAVRNKDITKTADNVQSIAAQLKAAGIGV